MGFWDFLKKFSKKQEQKETEKLNLAEFNNWLRKQKKEKQNKEKEIIEQINLKINKVIEEIKEEIKVLENINLEERKAEEKIKLIVKENLNNYVSYLKKLIENLLEIKERGINKTIEKINFIFSDFDKRSRISFEKTTFLVGKEMGIVKETISKFFKDLEKFLKENEKFLKKEKILLIIGIKYDNLSNLELTERQFKQNLKDIEEHKDNLKKQIQNLKEEIEKIKQSEEYSENLKQQQELENEKENLQNKILELKNMIDFKNLTNKFHSNEKEMRIIKKYRENFQEFFKKDKGEGIIELFELNKNKQEISSQLDKINKIEQEIKNTIIKDTEINNINDKIKEINLEIENLDLEKVKKLKNFNKTKIQKHNIINEIKEELEKFLSIKIGIGIDAAASSFFNKTYNYKNPEKTKSNEEQIRYINSIIEKFNLVYVEDPLEEKDFTGFSKLNKKAMIVGDDLIATDIKRLEKAIAMKSINAVIVKPNQNGSLLQVKKFCEIAKKHKILTIFSHRSGETLDSWLADLAYAFKADFLKSGILGEERLVKLRRLREIVG